MEFEVVFFGKNRIKITREERDAMIAAIKNDSSAFIIPRLEALIPLRPVPAIIKNESRSSLTGGQYLPSFQELESGMPSHMLAYESRKQELIDQKSIPALTDPEQAMARAEIQERQSTY